MQIFIIMSICFFLSGATALVYEIIWVRLLSLTFGNTVYAIGIVLMAFMSGLALGSSRLGKWADRGGNLLKAYGVLEAGIAIFAMLSPFLIKAVSYIYIHLIPYGLPEWMASSIKYMLSFLVLLVPTTMMGGTLPVLSRYFIRSQQDFEKRLGFLYAINTLGGVVGVFLVGFVLLSTVGITMSLRIAGLTNLIIGAVSYYIGRGLSIKPDGDSALQAVASSPIESPSERHPHRKYAIIAFLISGAGAMMYQVSWTRLLVNVLGSSTYAFSLILMGFLLGIGFGSIIISVLSRRRGFGLVHFAIIEIAIGITASLSIFYFDQLPIYLFKTLAVTENVRYVFGVEFMLILLYILLPTTLMGALFPIIAHFYNDGSSMTGKDIGYIYASNTVGCIIGSALGSFLFLPLAGSIPTIKTAAVLNILIGVTGVFILKKYRMFAVSVLMLAIPFVPSSVSKEYLSMGIFVYGSTGSIPNLSEDRHIVYYKEGLNATISVLAEKRTGNLMLKTNGKTDASMGYDMSTQLALGYFPVMLHPAPKSALIIGFGSGATARAVADYSGISNIDCVEIEPAVLEASGYFKKVNEGVVSNPKVRLIVDDARSYINKTRKTYDIIISEPSNPWVSGVGNLFTKEFYKESLKKLSTGGLFCQWVQLYTLRGADLKMILRTFADTFPLTTVWYSSGGDILLIGFKSPVVGFDYNEIKGKLTCKMASDLKGYLNISTPEDFLSFYVTDTNGLKEISGRANINSDDRPFLEFNAPFSIYSDTIKRNNEIIQESMRIPPIINIPKDINLLPELLYRKSKNYHFLRIPVSLEWTEQALFIAPNNYDYTIQHAKIARESTNDILQEVLSGIIAKYPEHPQANFEMAMLYKKTDTKLAAKYIEKTLKTKSDEFDYLFEAARLMYINKNYPRAIKCFEIALSLPHRVSDEPTIFYELGISYLVTGREEAKIYFEKYLEALPYNGQSLFMAAEELVKIYPDTACKFYKQAKGQYPPAEGIIEERLETFCSKTY